MAWGAQSKSVSRSVEVAQASGPYQVMAKMAMPHKFGDMACILSVMHRANPVHHRPHFPDLRVIRGERLR